MSCQRCASNRVLSASAKCSDLFSASIGGKEHDGYVPSDLGIGNRYGDYMDVEFCMDCGQMQGVFPLPPAALESDDDD
jgi:hypothetical protein